MNAEKSCKDAFFCKKTAEIRGFCVNWLFYEGKLFQKSSELENNFNDSRNLSVCNLNVCFSLHCVVNSMWNKRLFVAAYIHRWCGFSCGSGHLYTADLILQLLSEWGFFKIHCGFLVIIFNLGLIVGKKFCKLQVRLPGWLFLGYNRSRDQWFLNLGLVFSSLIVVWWCVSKILHGNKLSQTGSTVVKVLALSFLLFWGEGFRGQKLWTANLSCKCLMYQFHCFHKFDEFLFAVCWFDGKMV